MQLPLQITLRNIAHTDAIDAAIREKAAKLEQFNSKIVSCRVVVEQADRHKHQGRQFVVHLDIKIPGREIAINRDHDEDLYVALRDAFNAAKRQVEEALREKRGEVKHHEPQKPPPAEA